MFYFQQLLNQGLGGIDQTAMVPAIVGIAYSILLVGFLIGIYQSALRGGDLQSLAVAGIKYLVVAIVLANWSTVFHEINDSCNQIAQFIDNSSGAGDMFLSWMNQLEQQFSNNGFSAILPAISGTMAAIASTLAILAAYLIYAIAVVVFGFFYVLYGCVLYVLGPLVLALLPTAGVGQLAKSYATNVMIWNAWGILYATFGSLITAIQFNRVDQVMSQGFLNGFFQGTTDSIALGLVSIVYALALILIPFIAKRLISGDVGSSAYSLVRASGAAAGALISGISGFAAGIGVSEGGMALATTTSTSPVAAGGAMAAGMSASTPPPQPTLAETIRGGIKSAVGSSAPQVPLSSGNGTKEQSGVVPSGPLIPITARSVLSSGVRPIGATQTIAFHAGKFAGTIVGGAADGASSKTGGNP